MKMTAVVTSFVCRGRQAICLSPTGTVTLGDDRPLIGVGDPQGVPRSDRRIKMANLFCMPCRAEAGFASAQSRPQVSSRQTYSSMRGNSRSLIGSDGNVIRFRSRGNAPRRELSLGSCDTTGDSPVEDLRKYEYRSENDDDYRHRMLVNFLATIVLIVMMVTGSWMVDTIINSWPGR
jgi:hypothetical protein